MTASRIITRALLLGVKLLAIVVIILSIMQGGLGEPEVWAAVAGALAVIAAVIAAWPAQRVLELEQEARKPAPYPSIDLRSRRWLMQLRVTNHGGSLARDINLEWEKPLLNRDGEPIKFSLQEGAPEIPLLMPGESVSMFLGGSAEMYQMYQDMNYTGIISYEDAARRQYSDSFFVSAESYRRTLIYEDDQAQTLYELQKIPKELERLRKEFAREITKLREHFKPIIDSREKPEMSSE